MRGVWYALLLACLVLVLIPSQDGGQGMKTAGWLGDYAAGVARSMYGLIRIAMPWLVVGMLFALTWPRRGVQRWAVGVALGCFLLGWAILPGMGWTEVREILFVLPGLAAGLWIGERTQGFKSLSAPAFETRSPAAEPASSAPTGDTSESLHSGLPLSPTSALPGRIAGLILLAAALFSVVDFPDGRIALALGLAAYGTLLGVRPQAWLVIVPAALPLLDFAPWTGRFFWDEFDLLMLTTLAVGMWQGQFSSTAWKVPRLGILLALFLLVTGVSLLKGLFPLQDWDANAFSAYWSHYNSLRLAKGVLWGLVFYGLYRSLPDKDAAFSKLAAGMTLGVLGVSAWALWEQMQFAGTATTADYRVTGSFSSMHTGGGHFEAYLVIALPFVWGWFFATRNVFARGAIAAIFLLGAYALFSTVARGGAIALGVALAVLVAGTWRALGKQTRHRSRFAAPVLLGVLTVAVMVAGASGVFWKQRIAQTADDADIRLRHWSGILDLRDAGWLAALFGQGLGSLPASNLASQLPDQAGSYRYADDGGNPYLALNSAGTLYMAQRVAPRPGETLTLQLSARAPAGQAGLEASLCEKNLFNSRRCQWLKLDVKPGAQPWQTFSQTFSSGDVGAGNVFSRRPVQFSLYNPVPGTVIEVDSIRLLDGAGQGLLKNGDFSQGGDFWFFNSGNHLFWHAKNLWVHLLFEQGWLGALLFSLIMILALVRLARPASHGALQPTVWLAALCALATVGGVDSLVDAPRLALLVYGVLFVGAAWGALPRARGEKSRRVRHRPRPHPQARA